MSDVPSVVTDAAGHTARVEPASPESAGRLVLRLDSGERVEVARDLVELDGDGAARLPIAFSSIVGAEAARIVLAEETLHVGKRVRETGRVRVTKHVDVREEIVDEPLVRESVEIDRVPVGRYVDDLVPTRSDGDTTIVSVVEEVVVVEKKLYLKEELHITKRRAEHRDPQRVTLRAERVEVERIEADADAPPEER